MNFHTVIHKRVMNIKLYEFIMQHIRFIVLAFFLRCKDFIDAIWLTEKEKIREKVRQARFLSVICDGATDSSHVEAEIFFIRLAVDGEAGNFGFENLALKVK